MTLSIVVPAYNEAENLRLLIPRLNTVLLKLGITYEMIVVDNASTDDTLLILQQLSAQYAALRVVIEKEKGFGAAVLSGLRQATGDILGYIHADNQMDPEVIRTIYTVMHETGAAVCKARRMERHDGIWRWIISRVYNVLFPCMFDVQLRDINGSPKLFTRVFFQKARLTSKDWFIDPEIIIKAKRLAMTIREVDIGTFAREHGSSQVRLNTIAEFLKNMVHYWRHKDTYEE